MDGEVLINMVNKAVTAIMSRLQSMYFFHKSCLFSIFFNLSLFLDLSTFDGTESKVATLVAAANSHDNLCRMDPAWHPWL